MGRDQYAKGEVENSKWESILVGIVIGAILCVSILLLAYLLQSEEQSKSQYHPRIYIVCSNQSAQDIWEHRTEYASFDCECDNSGCRKYPSIRNCDADGLHIICTEIKV